MNRGNPLVVAVVLLSTLTMGLWGCSQQGGGAVGAKVRELEARYTKLEDDFRAVNAANDLGRKKLHHTEAGLKEAMARNEELGKQVEELRVVVQERDDLRKQLQTRTAERDAVHSQFVQFSKDLQALAGRVETAANTISGPSLTAAIPTSNSTTRTDKE